MWIALVLASTLGAQVPRKPKLVVAVVVDQFRYDYLTRFRADYHGGLDRMLRQGAVFTNAHYVQAPTVTAVGHSIIMTGAMPSVSGIVGNTWLDRNSGKHVTSVCDWDYQVVGAATPEQGKRCDDADPASPKRLLVSTVGDELRNRDERSKVFGISLKARSAILPSGHRANGAFWFDDKTGVFVSSTYYGEQLPLWVREFNQRKLPDQFLNANWKGFESWNFHPDPGSLRPYEKLPASPWANELLEGLAEKAIDAEKLGQRDATDLLTLSFSANDYVGHQTGPDTPEVRDMAIRTDQLLGKLMDLVAERVGAENALFVLSADHGVAPAPETEQQRKMPGGYISVDVEDLVRTTLVRSFGPGDYIQGVVDNAIYLNHKTLDDKKIDVTPLYRAVSEALFRVPQAHVARVFTKEQLSGGLAGDPIGRAMSNGFNPARSGDILLLFEPYFMPKQRPSAKTTHFTPYNYDTHVPVIFFGAGVKAGWRQEKIEVNDIAPTLAALMDVETPSGAFGRVLTEILAAQ
ncbi:MAG: alkaline phosphatase family protein [Acidobacteriia bacterium]|nr:alkaline phosphatase family protein [Terriglobia bacterium]